MSSGHHELSITVAVRVRPFTATELLYLAELLHVRPVDNVQLAAPVAAEGRLRRVLRVDDRMLVFDPEPAEGGANADKSLAECANEGANEGMTRRHNRRRRPHRFVFDRLLDETAGQSHTFEATVRPVVDSVLDGYNATVFAYGATGCGKTHTIVGPEHDPGLVFLATRDLYRRLEARPDRPQVTMSYLEIYNETVRDLLQPDTVPARLVIRESAGGRMTVANLASRTPGTADDVMQLVADGNRNRTSAATDANAVSSRLHAVLQLTITTSVPHDDAVQVQVTTATLTFVDLAGSERAAASSNRGCRLQEGANINRSLLALGNCINALCDPRRHKHVPYRDSKLTRLLKFSLGGNCRTVMIACVLPLSHHAEETLNTLKYADRAKHISTKAVRNQLTVDRHVSTLRATVMSQQRELTHLRAKVVKLERQTQRAILSNSQHLQLSFLHISLDLLRQLWARVDSMSGLRRRKCTLLAKRLVLFRFRVQALFVAENQPAQDLVGDLVQAVDKAIAQLEAQYSRADEADEQFASAVQDAAGDEVQQVLVLLARQNYAGLVVQRLLIFAESLLCAIPELSVGPGGQHMLKKGDSDTSADPDFFRVGAQLAGGGYDAAIDNHSRWFFGQPHNQSLHLLCDILPTGIGAPSRRRKSQRLVSAEKRVRWDLDASQDPSDFTIDESESGSPKVPVFESHDLSFEGPGLPPLGPVSGGELNKLAVNKVRRRIPLTARKLPTAENKEPVGAVASLTPVHSPRSEET